MLEKKYNHLEVEKGKYENWKSKNYFNCDTKSDKTPFCIVIPPPNVTGVLHMGHALDNTLQDILARYKRMCGFSTLWLPGTDHASIATEAKIVEQMRKEGVTKEDIGKTISVCYIITDFKHIPHCPIWDKCLVIMICRVTHWKHTLRKKFKLLWENKILKKTLFKRGQYFCLKFHKGLCEGI